jgi:hypothetical protein
MLPTYDAEIRQAFHKKKLCNQHSNKNTLVIDELGLLHGSNRIDIAVVNECIHGYEIKSSKDTLSRLETQLEAYKKSLQKITFITAPNHLGEIEKKIPDWCGIILADKGRNGAIHFSTVRKPQLNPYVDSLTVAHLLWKNEAQELLVELGATNSQIKGNRIDLYKSIVERLNLKQLVIEVKRTFISRENWRVGEQLK